VGTYPDGISPYGCYDMAGNVWEWTSSAYRAFPYNPIDGREQWESKDERVQRGGSWDSGPLAARVFCRGGCPPTILDDNIGARLVRGNVAGS